MHSSKLQGQDVPRFFDRVTHTRRQADVQSSTHLDIAVHSILRHGQHLADASAKH